MGLMPLSVEPDVTKKRVAKERVFSFRDNKHRWDPKNQRPELWSLYNGRVNKGESIRVFPMSNWTELDVCNTFTWKAFRLCLCISQRHDRWLIAKASC